MKSLIIDLKDKASSSDSPIQSIRETSIKVKEEVQDAGYPEIGKERNSDEIQSLIDRTDKKSKDDSSQVEAVKIDGMTRSSKRLQNKKANIKSAPCKGRVSCD